VEEEYKLNFRERHVRVKPRKDPNAFKPIRVRIPREMDDKLRLLGRSITEHVERDLNLYLPALGSYHDKDNLSCKGNKRIAKGLEGQDKESN
jgi:hypothetical protein